MVEPPGPPPMTNTSHRYCGEAVGAADMVVCAVVRCGHFTAPTRAFKSAPTGSRARAGALALGSGARQIRRHHAHRDDVFERLVHAHVELDHVGLAYHQEETRGGGGRGRDIDAQIFPAAAM